MTALVIDELAFLDWASEAVELDEDDPETSAQGLWRDVTEVIALAEAATPPADVTRWTPEAVRAFLATLPVADDQGEHRDDLAQAVGVLVAYLGEAGRWMGNPDDIWGIERVVAHVLDPYEPEHTDGATRQVITLSWGEDDEDDEITGELAPVVAIASADMSATDAAHLDDLLAASPLLSQLGSLLAWIEPGRTVAKTGGLGRGDFQAAAATVGARVPAGRVTSMWDIGALGDMWRVAAWAGLIDIGRSSVRLTDAGAALLPRSPTHRGAPLLTAARRRAAVAFFAMSTTRPGGKFTPRLDPPVYADLYDLQPHLVTLATGGTIRRADLLRRSYAGGLVEPGDPVDEDPWFMAHHVGPVQGTLAQWRALGLATSEEEGPEAGTRLLPPVRPLAAAALLAVLRVEVPGLPGMPDLIAATWPDPAVAPAAVPGDGRPSLTHRLRVTSDTPRGTATREVTIDGEATLEDVHAAIAQATGRSSFGPFTISAPTLGSRTVAWLSDGLEIDIWSGSVIQLGAWTTTLTQAVRSTRGPWSYHHDLRHDRRDTVTPLGPVH